MERTHVHKPEGHPDVERWDHYGLVDVKLRTQDSDLWICHPEARAELEGEEAVREWREAADKVASARESRVTPTPPLA